MIRRKPHGGPDAARHAAGRRPGGPGPPRRRRHVRMTAARTALTRDDLAPLARAALGRTRVLTGVRRLRGGSKKGVYRLALDDGSTAVAYVWSPDEDYWDEQPADPHDPFSHASGLDLLTASYERLTAVG